MPQVGQARGTRSELRVGYLISAARTVLTRSMAIVIGPTPPGTGVIAPAMREAGLPAVWFDVRTVMLTDRQFGSAAFMQTREQARELARAMVAHGVKHV